jgi:DNA-binding CsgD family transcriptional regulator
LSAPPLAILPADVLALFRRAREAQGTTFGAACFEWLRRYVRFDALLVSVAPKANLSFGQTLSHGLDERALFESYAKVAHLDALSRYLITHPGTVRSLDIDAPEHATERHRPYREHLERFELSHGAGLSLPSADGELVFLLLFLRKTPGERMSEADLQAVPSLAPYLIEAVLLQRMAALGTSSQLRLDELPLALIDDAGCFKQMTPAFARSYSPERAVAQGYLYLGTEVLKHVTRGGAWTLPDGQVLYAVRDERGFLLHIRPKSKADALSARERQVADAYAGGSSYTEIAEALDIAPSTVRRHITNLYEKLCISHRVDLIAILPTEPKRTAWRQFDAQPPLGTKATSSISSSKSAPVALSNTN